MADPGDGQGPGGPVPAAAHPTRAELRAARAAGRRRRGRHAVAAGAAAGAVVVALVVTGTAGPARSQSPPAPRLHATLATTRQVPAADPALPWPATGQAAVAIPAIGYTAQSGAEHPVPVASMTKVMTAYVVLHDHPLAGTTPGPSITLTTADADDYDTDVVTTQASVDVQAGEVLTERQALDGMLVHSANNLAYALACWDAGSLPAFLAEMNAAAAALGMTQTHYADASGYTPGSVSTPSDLLKVTAAAMDQPAFAQAVAMPAVTLPVAGTVSSYTPMLPGGVTGPTPGVVGVKSGFTDAAGGGDILAYQATVHGSPLTVLAAVTSQEGPTVLHAAGEMDLGLAQAAAAGVVAVPLVAARQRVGSESAGGRSVPVVTTSAATLLAWPGQEVHQAVVAGARLRAGAPAGAPAGTARFRLGQQQVTVPLATAARLPATG
jgi:D-alanyl-D-alanine carboxypeptidase (penicillin-binding protein 5/6)